MKLVRSIGGQEHHGHRAQISSKEAEQFEGRTIGPVDVLEDDRNRSALTQLRQEVQQVLEQAALPGAIGGRVGSLEPSARARASGAPARPGRSQPSPPVRRGRPSASSLAGPRSPRRTADPRLRAGGNRPPAHAHRRRRRDVRPHARIGSCRRRPHPRPAGRADCQGVPRREPPRLGRVRSRRPMKVGLETREAIGHCASPVQRPADRSTSWLSARVGLMSTWSYQPSRRDQVRFGSVRVNSRSRRWRTGRRGGTTSR